MSEEIKDLAKRAGFVFFEEDETHAGRAGQIDWSNNYDTELERFAVLVGVFVLKGMQK